MTNSFKRVKACILMSIFLFSLLAVFIPKSSAAGSGLYTSTIEIDSVKGGVIEQGLKPQDTSAIISITIKYKIQGIGAKAIAEFLRNMGRDADVDVTIGTKPEWLSISPVEGTSFSVQIYSEYDENAYVTRDFRVKFTKDAPAYVDANVLVEFKVKDTILPIVKITGDSVSAPVDIFAKFYPIVQAVPEDSYMEIAPGNTATYSVKCTNEGNSLTEFVFIKPKLPKDWTISFPNEVLVDAGETVIVQIEVTPPYGFGYHNEDQVIDIAYYGRYYSEGEIQSQNKTLTLKLRNKGFSTPGFEAPSLIMIFAFVAIALVIFKRHKKIK